MSSTAVPPRHAMPPIDAVSAAPDILPRPVSSIADHNHWRTMYYMQHNALGLTQYVTGVANTEED